MALIKCPECQKEVSDQAESCPNCGIKMPKKWYNKNIGCFSVIVLLGLLFFLIGEFSKNNTVSVVQDQKNASSSFQTTEAFNIEPKLSNSPTVEIPQMKWEYSQSKDEMRGGNSYEASLASDNKAYFEFPYNGGSRLSINLRKSPRYGNDVYFVITKGQFSCAYNGCIVAVKFDDGKIINYSVVESDSGRSDVLFLANSKTVRQFASRLKKAKNVVVEVSFYQDGKRQFTFSPKDLEWNHF